MAQPTSTNVRPAAPRGIARLAAIVERAPLPLAPAHGVEGPLLCAVIDESWCIGCTLCLKACPVDCIVGAAKVMHTVLASACTGCELCLPACPVDCISLVPVSGERTGWEAWSAAQADSARRRYKDHRARAEVECRPPPAAPAAADRKQSIVAAALAKARAARER